MTSERAKRVPEDISRGRVEALSDGVFAIVVTLLVLEIKVPHLTTHDSLSELASALAHVCAFLRLSFRNSLKTRGHFLVFQKV